MFIKSILFIILILIVEYFTLGKIFWFTQIFFFNPKSKKLVLTFDDGPHPKFTEEVMGILKKYKIKATFFVCGKESEENPEIIRKLIADGHEIGNHSWNHLKMIFKSPKRIEQEIVQTDNLLRKLGVKGKIYFRPPFMRFLFITPIVVAKLKKKMVLWNIPTKDYKAKSVEEISKRVFDKCTNGGIIVMHDGRADRTLSVKALDKIVPELLEKGYEFTLLSEYLNYQ
jgi:peptidoglycan/xylan/chitin deacetylase (PgdA/CDA1 family)